MKQLIFKKNDHFTKYSKENEYDFINFKDYFSSYESTQTFSKSTINFIEQNIKNQINIVENLVNIRQKIRGWQIQSIVAEIFLDIIENNEKYEVRYEMA